ncbi:hypothetical protein KDA08_01910, partial [Candidatus Saccharibacteria bacterium]|nr:hypothetical protein [Candidatus Saccharibacteria bacterium]
TSTPINKQTAIKKTEQPVKAVSVKKDIPVVVQEQTVTPIVTAAQPACDSYDALIIENFGSENLITAKAIMRAESGCDANATGDKSLTYQQNGRTYGYSVSLFQVRILPGREGCDSHDPAVNIPCAAKVYRSQGWMAWSVCRVKVRCN